MASNGHLRVSHCCWLLVSVCAVVLCANTAAGAQMVGPSRITSSTQQETAAAPKQDTPNAWVQYLQQQSVFEKLSAVNDLVHWLLANHAEVNVEVRDGGPGAGLALYAIKDVQQGDVLLSLPTDLGFRRTSSVGVMDFLLEYVLDVYDPASPRGLMWSTSPRPHELRHLLNFPTEYLPLLQHKELEEWIGHGLHYDIQLFYTRHADVLTAAGITYEDLTHAMGLVGTRTFNKPNADGSSTFYALPLLDMANHNNNCPHGNVFRPCHFDSSRECVYFAAGADVAAGQEVCFFYGHLLPDRALLEYGYLPEQQHLQDVLGVSDPASTTMGPELFGIDRHDADFDAEPLMKFYEKPAAYVSRSRAEIAARTAALQQLLQHLKNGNELAQQVESQGPAAGDAEGSFLAQLLLWRQQRQKAVAAEIRRLQAMSQQHDLKPLLSSA